METFNFKKRFSTILLLLCCMLTHAQEDGSQDYNRVFTLCDFEKDGICYNITSANTVEVAIGWCELYTQEWEYIGGGYNSYDGKYIDIPLTVEHDWRVYSVTGIGEQAFIDCNIGVNIPNSVISIADRAFNNAICDITIPASVTSINGSAFLYCDLGYVVVDERNPVYDSRNNCNAIIETSTNTLIKGGPFTVIPNSVTAIADNAFNNCSAEGDFGHSYSCNYSNWYNREMTIGCNVSSLGKIVFSSCGFPERIYLHGTTPPSAQEDSFTHSHFDNMTLYVPYGAKDIYASTEVWKNFKNIVEYQPTTLVSINKYGNATFCSQYALDFSNVEGLKAYSAIGYNSNTQVITLARVMTTPAETGIFLKGEPGEYIVPIIDECNDHFMNMLVGTLEQTTVNSTTGEMSNFKFTVTNSDKVPKFYQFEDNTTFSAGKAYLQLPTEWLPQTAQKSVGIRFEDAETTGVEELEEQSEKNEAVYDLQGRQVDKPTCGIYIINGKKVLLK